MIEGNFRKVEYQAFRSYVLKNFLKILWTTNLSFNSKKTQSILSKYLCPYHRYRNACKGRGYNTQNIPTFLNEIGKHCLRYYLLPPGTVVSGSLNN